MNMAHLLAIQLSGAGGWLGFCSAHFHLRDFLFSADHAAATASEVKWQQMLNDLKNGDKVVTSGGLRGTIIALRDDYIQLRVPPDMVSVSK